MFQKFVFTDKNGNVKTNFHLFLWRQHIGLAENFMIGYIKQV